jgi:hypothetical protein
MRPPGFLTHKLVFDTEVKQAPVSRSSSDPQTASAAAISSPFDAIRRSGVKITNRKSGPNVSGWLPSSMRRRARNALMRPSLHSPPRCSAPTRAMKAQWVVTSLVTRVEHRERTKMGGCDRGSRDSARTRTPRSASFSSWCPRARPRPDGAELAQLLLGFRSGGDASHHRWGSLPR